jgi:hypothetical protein
MTFRVVFNHFIRQYIPEGNSEQDKTLLMGIVVAKTTAVQVSQSGLIYVS